MTRINAGIPNQLTNNKNKVMKSYNIAIRLTTGYSWDEAKGEYDTNSPINKTVNFENIQAESEKEAIKIAMERENSGHSIYDIYTY